MQVQSISAWINMLRYLNSRFSLHFHFFTITIPNWCGGVKYIEYLKIIYVHFNKRNVWLSACWWVRVSARKEERVRSLYMLFQYLYYVNVFQIQPGDGLPAFVCEECENLVNICYNFKLQVEKSNLTLKKYYANQEEYLPLTKVWCHPVLNFNIKQRTRTISVQWTDLFCLVSC